MVCEVSEQTQQHWMFRTDERSYIHTIHPNNGSSLTNAAYRLLLLVNLVGRTPGETCELEPYSGLFVMHLTGKRRAPT